MADNAGRRAGVLLHITSLPGGGGNGDLGAEAHNFLGFLSSCGVSVWQVLPVGPTSHDLSPYQSSSVHAGNPRLISIEQLAHLGWLDESMIDAPLAEALEAAYQGFHGNADRDIQAEYQRFGFANAEWLDDFALFQAVHDAQGAGWWAWPAALRDRDPGALAGARREFGDAIDRIRFQQFVFFRQWEALRVHAGQLGIHLFGDMPIFVALDSAEVWARPDLFDLDAGGKPNRVAGVPPDYFSATGQRWGNPLYRWDRMAATGFEFWTRRMQTQLTMFDLVRIDHFRGFVDYWEIPADEADGVNGRWRSGPGEALFAALEREFGELPIVAEDLGLITDKVRQLRDRLGLPGMEVLQFAFDGQPKNPYLPFNHAAQAVVYTGTHDNDTVVGWYSGLNDDERERVQAYLGYPSTDIARAMVHQALMSPARLAVLPMQDLLGLGGDARMNTPGTMSERNWRWRFQWDQVPPQLAADLRHRIWMTDRLVV